MTPLQIKQQKFSKLSSVMQPELMKIQKNIRIKRSGFHAENAGRNLSSLPEIRSITYRKLCSAFDPTSDPVVSVACNPEYSCLCWQCKSVLDGVASQIIGVSGYTNILQDFITDNKMTRVRLILEEKPQPQILSLTFCMLFLRHSGINWAI